MRFRGLGCRVLWIRVHGSVLQNGGSQGHEVGDFCTPSQKTKSAANIKPTAVIMITVLYTKKMLGNVFFFF